jgi:hypothetical protein
MEVAFRLVELSVARPFFKGVVEAFKRAVSADPGAASLEITPRPDMRLAHLKWRGRHFMVTEVGTFYYSGPSAGLMLLPPGMKWLTMPESIDRKHTYWLEVETPTLFGPEARNYEVAPSYLIITASHR